MSNQWKTIVDFRLVIDAEASWDQWLQTHDVSKLGPNDFRIDTGRGQEGDVRRYCIRQAAVEKVQLLLKRQ